MDENSQSHEIDQQEEKNESDEQSQDSESDEQHPYLAMDDGESSNPYFDKLFDRYKLFGGILRNVMANEEKLKVTKKDLEDRLLGLDMDVLQSKAANIDRDPTGWDLSGYILCYDGKDTAMNIRRVGRGIGFNECVLNYTSMFVEEQVQRLLERTPLVKKMKVVNDKLDDRVVDLSGKNLEAVATEFLRTGQVEWLTKRAGSDDDWVPFIPLEREVIREYDISGLLTCPNAILVPTDPSFPVADIVVSSWGQDSVYTFQCTWQERHPFTVRALYELRNEKLKVEHTKRVVIFFVVPQLEDLYAKRKEDAFLQGSLDVPLLYNKRVEVPPTDLRQMWSNTKVYVLRPSSSWQEMISTWLTNWSKEEQVKSSQGLQL